MGPFKRKHQATAQIRFTSSDGFAKSSTKKWLTNETINGFAIFQLPSGVEISYAQLSLKGSIRSRIEEDSRSSLQPHASSERYEFLGATYKKKERSIIRSEDGSAKVPFSFSLKECERLSTIGPSLPPSIESKDDISRTSPSRAQYSIAYNLVATAFSSDKHQIASSTEKVYITPLSDAPESTNFPSEYHWAEQLAKPSKGLHLPTHSHHTTTPSYHIDVAAQEPEPIAMCAHSDVSEGATDIPFVVKLSPEESTTIEQEPNQCQVSAQLVTKTTLTPEGAKLMESQSEFPKYLGPKNVSIHKSHNQQFTISMPKWERYSSSPEEPFSLARFSYLFDIDGERPPLPSFNTPLLSRSYSIDLTLSFPDQSLKLSLPLEILHEESDASDCDKKKSRRSIVSESRL